MIEKEFNDRIYTKSTAKREKYTIFMGQRIFLVGKLSFKRIA
jgi:hypothetical protein